MKITTSQEVVLKMPVEGQRRYDMRHEMLTQRAPFCIGAMA